MITFNPPMKWNHIFPLQKASSLTLVASTNFLRDATSSIGVFGPSIGLAEEAAPIFSCDSVALIGEKDKL